ncbi:MAG: ubiquinone biosynthesis regulatory protein kinase UbiB [Pseudomonadales bacterium]|nr:ubiquinone biosynthesis regulatory protein kinase UbiB [Pseudomonadales bacterium]
MTRLARLLTILHVFAKYRLDELLPDHPAALPIRWFIRLFPSAWGRKKSTDPWERLRLALEELGPVFIKFGQLLSTRRDLLPDDAIEDLSKLQDQVPPFSEQAAIDIIESELKAPVTQLFSEFERKPLASASVAQVHTAVLPTGEDVVVKVVRPGIEKVVKRDVALLKSMAKLLVSLIPETTRFHPQQVVSDYEHIILGELDLGHEAANAAQFRRNFEGSPLLYVPDIYWQYSTPNVLTMERIYGVPVSDTEAMEKAGIDLETLSEIGVEIFFTQVFRDNFFHADMHPGNVFVSLEDPNQPQYISLDHAIAGSLSREERSLLARQLMALLDKDYEQIALLLIEAGWVPPHTRVTEFTHALRTVLEPVLEKPLQDIEFGPILVRLFNTARRFEMQALPQFVLLEKTLIHIEGLGRQLYPELDIWSVGRPLLEQWIRDQLGPSSVMQTIKRNGPALAEQIPQIPKMAFEALQEVRKLSSNQERILQAMHEQHVKSLRKERVTTLLGFAGIIIGGFWAIQPNAIPNLSDIPWPAWAMGAGGLFLIASKNFRRTL